MFPCGEPQARLYRHSGLPVLRIHKTGSFVFDGDTIRLKLEPGAAPVPYLLGRVLGLWLELAGFPLLHGSCVELEQGGVGFLGDSGAGKSSFSAALCAQGRRLLTDDLIPLLWKDEALVVHPGIPLARMWPDTGNFFVKNFSGYEKIHPGVEKRKVPRKWDGSPLFSENPRPLERIFILERVLKAGPIQIDAMAPAEALMTLVRLSYRPEPVHALGLQPQRMAALARVVKEIPVVRLKYPTGFETLSKLAKFILENQNEAFGVSQSIEL